MSRTLIRKITIEDLSEDLTLRKEYFKIDEKYPGEMGEMFEFFLDLLILRGRSFNTVKSYYNDLCTFYDFFKDFYPNITSITQIKKIHINKYFMYCQSQRKNSNSSLDRKEKTITLFFRVLEEQGVIEPGDSPLTKRDSLKRRSEKNKKIPVYAEDFELEELFTEVLNEKNKFIRNRDYCIFALLFYLGLRISELLSLDIKDIEYLKHNGYITVLGKGDKERTIPIHKSAFEDGYLKFMDEYLKIRQAYLKPDRFPEDTEALFIGRECNRLGSDGVRSRLKKYINNIGLKKNLTPHKLRHTFATQLLKVGVNIRVVQELLGHESVGTTQIYSHVDNKDKASATEKLALRIKQTTESNEVEEAI